MKNFFYRVKEGDCIVGIAERFDVPPFALIADNELTREIRAGDIVFVEKIERPTRRVRPGEDLASVINSSGLTDGEFMRLNGYPPYVFCGLNVYC